MKKIIFVLVACASLVACSQKPREMAKPERQVWVESLTEVSKPVLENLAAGTLKEKMHFESLSDDPDRRKVSYLEAVGRTLCGIAPWLELGPDETEEGKLRAKYLDLTLKALENAFDPDCPDCLEFWNPKQRQPLVDAAFLAEGLLRAPTQLWGRLSGQTRERVILRFQESRRIEPYRNNWLLFASMIEAFLLEQTGECDLPRLRGGVDQFMTGGWYKGDGWYSDGDAFHLDYYNSIVIHPMLTEVLQVMERHGLSAGLEEQLKRHMRLAEQLERFISPDGTYPVVGRSIAYRCGVFHALADAVLMHLIPEPGETRSAMTAVLRRQMSSPDNFDEEGWLRIGFCGSQLEISERYINTGSSYLCTAFFLPLGLPADDPFWTAPAQDWATKRAWQGQRVQADHAIRN